ncbi:hypothetical protein O3M35_011159 [Rhynocoris fuscipes]|uniref:C2H2-type domain-containing protein n=1 Tax=Rhynocoris fuscipes TaxID=488301 RepID=A0AAW1CX49_9HEMI
MQASEASISLACISLKMDECPKPVQPSRKTSRVLTEDYLLEKKFICQVCHRQYRYYQGLYNHKRFECGKDPQFHCTQCPFKCKQKISLRRHLASKHNSL